MRLVNSLVILLIILLICVALYLIYKKSIGLSNNMEEEKNHFDLKYLGITVQNLINEILKADISELNLNKVETSKREEKQKELRKSLYDASFGDVGAKEYIKERIKELLEKKQGVNEHNIDSIIPFDNTKKLTKFDKHEILLYLYMKDHRINAFAKLIEENNLANAKKTDTGNIFYEINEKEINEIFSRKNATLSYYDKLNILAQRIYESRYGYGAVDILKDQNIDEILGGVNGIPEHFYSYDRFSKNNHVPFSYESVWVVFEGKSIHLSYLSFQTQKELERVCKNIYRFNSPGMLSEEKAHIENDLKDGSRIVVVRPPFADSWAFILRKHKLTTETTKATIDQTIVDKGNHIVIQTMKALVKGCQITAITGQKNTGKTTLLRQLIEFINPAYGLRIQEQIFELSLRIMYPYRQIITFKELPTISGLEGIYVSKKTGGDVSILGEVAEPAMGNWIIQMSQMASIFTMFTNHAKTTKDLIEWLRNALLKESGFHSENIAEQQVVNTIGFDIHLMNSIDGHRYIQRITEIIPIEGKDKNYELKNIIIFENGEYKKINSISKARSQEMLMYLTEEEKQELGFLFDGEANE